MTGTGKTHDENISVITRRTLVRPFVIGDLHDGTVGNDVFTSEHGEPLSPFSVESLPFGLKVLDKCTLSPDADSDPYPEGSVGD